MYQLTLISYNTTVFQIITSNGYNITAIIGCQNKRARRKLQDCTLLQLQRGCLAMKLLRIASASTSSFVTLQSTPQQCCSKRPGNNSSHPDHPLSLKQTLRRKLSGKSIHYHGRELRDRETAREIPLPY
jgi:hypothetical protein